MFTEKKQVFQLRIRTSNSNLLSHHKIIGSSVVNLCGKANIHLWPSILFPPPPPPILPSRSFYYDPPLYFVEANRKDVTYLRRLFQAQENLIRVNFSTTTKHKDFFNVVD